MNYELADTLLYSDENGSAYIKAITDEPNNTMWTTQQAMAEFFAKDVTTISKHLINIFESGELIKEEVSFNPNKSGDKIIINPKSKKQPVLYNLDAIISVGFRVWSQPAVRFRRWAIRIVREYVIKGFALDVGRLKNHFDSRECLFDTLDLDG